MNLIPVVTTYVIAIDRAMMDVLVAADRKFFSYHDSLVAKIEQIEGVSSADYDTEDSAIFVSINAPTDTPALHQIISRVIIQHLVTCRRLIRNGYNALHQVAE